ncbi:hypothetical protein MLD38_005120 [Melastoma candidum]|uniref:Uncharacterized protein n=1 Tax=Melastoma candidum TaxID=119954 RepID=A0ACB9SGG9_9MYRT|nr:hypothetical protein MLD38_005120 [Melastoma candidum]
MFSTTPPQPIHSTETLRPSSPLVLRIIPRVPVPPTPRSINPPMAQLPSDAKKATPRSIQSSFHATQETCNQSKTLWPSCSQGRGGEPFICTFLRLVLGSVSMYTIVPCSVEGEG